MTEYMKPDEALKNYRESIEEFKARETIDSTPKYTEQELAIMALSPESEEAYYLVKSARGAVDAANQAYRVNVKLNEEIAQLHAYIAKLEGALWNSTRNMQDIVKYGEKACNTDFKAAIEKNRNLLEPSHVPDEYAHPARESGEE